MILWMMGIDIYIKDTDIIYQKYKYSSSLKLLYFLNYIIFKIIHIFEKPNNCYFRYLLKLLFFFNQYFKKILIFFKIIKILIYNNIYNKYSII